MPERKYFLGSAYRYGFNGKELQNEITSDHYDFGSRIFDGRLGRWASPDPMQYMYPNISPYTYCINNPVKFVDREGKFVVDPAFKAAYPTVALILENADKIYYKMELPDDIKKALEGIDYNKIFNDNFKPLFEKISTGTDAQICEMLTNGKGPTIQSYRDLAPEKTTKELVEVGNGSFTKFRNGSESINISPEIVGVLEFEIQPDKAVTPYTGTEPLAGKSQDNGDRQVAFRIFVAEVFHESVHKLRLQNGQPERINNTDEAGKAFEIQVFGRNQGRLRSIDLTSSTNHKKHRTEAQSDKFNYNENEKDRKDSAEKFKNKETKDNADLKFY